MTMMGERTAVLHGLWCFPKMKTDTEELLFMLKGFDLDDSG